LEKKMKKIIYGILLFVNGAMPVFANEIEHRSVEIGSSPVKVASTCALSSRRVDLYTYSRYTGSATYCKVLKIWDNEIRYSKYLRRKVVVQSPVPGTEKIVRVLQSVSISGAETEGGGAQESCEARLKAIQESITTTECATDQVTSVR
jgi:hypothetical protein